LSLQTITSRGRHVFLIGSVLLMLLSGYWFYLSTGVMQIPASLLLVWTILMFTSVLRLSVEYRLPRRCLNIANPEAERRLYAVLGVRVFRSIIRRGPLHVFAPTMEIHGRKIRTRQLLREMEGAESIHGLSFLAVIVAATTALLFRKPLGTIWLVVFNILVNGYPVMLQRDNRVRLLRQIKRTGGT
jgi:hypothetical protein